jgi:conjugative relaxase-like TrwC/TraI family protein
VAVVADLAKLSVGREDYYVREVAHNREEYLYGHGESPGRWYGAGAAALGQEGTATTEGFKRIFEGRHPDTGELLGRAHGKGAVPSWDLVLRPVKDVGVLYALGDHHVNRAVMSAHHAGIAQAIAYLDAHVGTRRGHGGHQKVSGRGLVVVGFDHRTSREGDPLPHTHLIIANRTQGPDGRWTTLDGRDLYAHRRAADAIYRAAYQRSLTRSLGIAWGEADRWGNRPIVGMPTELVRAFSKLSKVTVHVKAIPGSKARDVVKVAVLPLGASSSDVSVEMTIRADGGLAGISRETLNLVVLEGLRQLGLTEVEVDAETGQ